MDNQGPRNFARIDFTKDECDAMYELAEAYDAMVQMQQQMGRWNSRQADKMRASVKSVKMKCGVASQMIKPEIISAAPDFALPDKFKPGTH